MSSPLTAPTPMASVPEASKRPVTRPTTAAAPDPSTPAHHATPSSNGFTSTFITPTTSRVAGKTIGKTLPGKHPSQSAMGFSTSNFGNLQGNFDSPSLLAMEPGGSSMGISMSALGLSTSALGGSSMGRLDDAERRRRLDNVLTTLGYTSGRVSQEGVQRLARKLGMEMYTETTDTHDMMTLAGDAYAVDLLFQPKNSANVKNVELHFHGLSDAVMTKAPDAARILHEQLLAPRGIPTVNVMLNRFAENLERLQRLDKLSIAGSSCFDSIAGVHASLDRLYRHERKIAEDLASSQTSTPKDMSGINVMCKKSGRPRMHAGGRVGLSLDYWRHKRRLHREPTGRFFADKMDVDVYSGSEAKNDTRGTGDSLCSLILECEYSSPALYPPIRIFDNWLSPGVTRTQDNEAEEMERPAPSEQLDWNDPPPLPSKTLEADLLASADDAHATQPRARFVATLAPSLVLPMSIAIQIYASVGVDISSEVAQTQAQQQTYDGLLLGRERSSQYQKSATVFDAQDQPVNHDWETRLYVARPEYGREITSIPFAHPRQLLPILPILRQYALFESLLRSVTPSPGAPSPSQARTNGDYKIPKERPNRRDELTALLEADDDVTASHASPPRILDVTLVQASPVPRLSIVVPAAEGPIMFSVEVQPNGEIIVEPAGAEMSKSEDKVEGMDKASARRRKGLTEALVVCEDLVLWAEWARGKVLRLN